MSAAVVSPDDANLRRAAEILRTGGLVGFPTETVYGLGGNALDERAVARIFEAKGRPRFDPLIVHVPDFMAAERLVEGFPADAVRMAERFWPGPLTLVLPKRAIVPDLVTAGEATVAIRVPDHPVAQALLRSAGLPLAAPSANPFGRISPTTAEHVAGQLGEQIDLILDGGPCRVGVESTVVELSPNGPRLLRPGGVPAEEIQELVGPLQIGATPSTGSRKSPGTLPQHYSPATPLYLAESPETVAELASRLPKPAGLLTLVKRPADGFARVEVLSASGHLTEAAANFFAALRRLDSSGLSCLVAHLVPEIGLGRALNDRLRRASVSAGTG